jgi:hypothetical protein
MLEKSKYFEFLQPKPDEKVEEREGDFMWFTNDGIVCTVPKEFQPILSIEESREQLVEFQNKYGKQKFKMLGVINPNTKSSKENRDYAAEILPDLVTAIALINNSALGRMAVNLFIGLKPPTYPLKIFKNSKDAFDWLRSIEE